MISHSCQRVVSVTLAFVYVRTSGGKNKCWIKLHVRISYLDMSEGICIVSRVISIRRSIYLTMVRPNIGYATQVWAPQSIDLMLKLERIQRRATRYILNLPFSSSVCYTSILQSLSLLPICYWHEYLDLVFLFKSTHGLIDLNHQLFLVCTVPDALVHPRMSSL